MRNIFKFIRYIRYMGSDIPHAKAEGVTVVVRNGPPCLQNAEVTVY